MKRFNLFSDYNVAQCMIVVLSTTQFGSKKIKNIIMRTFLFFFILLSISIAAHSQSSFSMKYDFDSGALLNNMRIVDDTIYVKGLISDKETGQPCILYARIDSFGVLIDYHQYCDSLGRVYTSNKNYPFIACTDGGFLIEDDIYGSGGNTGLYKLSKNGAVEFYTEYERPENIRTVLPKQLLELEDGYFVLHDIQLHDYTSRIQLIKLSKTGNIMWEEVYDRNEPTNLFGITKIDEDEILIIGSKAKKGIWFFTIDSLGNKQWERFLNNWPSGSFHLTLTQTGNGEWMYLSLPVTIFRRDPLRYGITPTVGKLTSEMEREWEDVVAESCWPTNDQLYTLKETPDGNWTVAGKMMAPFPSDVTEEGNWDAYEEHLCSYKFNPEGDSIWLHCYKPFEEEGLINSPSWVAHDVLSSGALVAAGYFYKNGVYHPVLVKVDKNGCLDTPCLPTSTEASSMNKDLKVYPNPARNLLNIKSEKAIKSYAIYSIYGQLLLSDMMSNTEIDILGLSSGTYFLSIEYVDGGRNVEKFVKMR